MRLPMGALIVGALLMVPSWSPAAEGEGGPSRFYVAAGGLASLTNYDLPNETGQQSSWGADGRVGYRVFSLLAVEAQYQWAARAEITSGMGEQQNVVETHTGTINAKVLPFDGPFQPYLLVGFGGMHATLRRGDDTLETALRIGGGVNFFFTDNVGIYGELTYLKPWGSIDGLSTVPIAFGGIFKF